MSRYSVSPAKKIFGITFLSLVLVAATYVVTSGKFNMNPNKDAAMTCQGTCYKANLCDSLDRQTAVGSCSTGYVCCGAKIGGSTPTPAPTAKPKTPTPAATCMPLGDYSCTSNEDCCSGICKGGGKGGNASPHCQPSEYDLMLYSGTCRDLCLSLDDTCISVGTNDGANNGKIMTWTKWSSCYTRSGNCTSTIRQLSTATTTCSGKKPEWTSCRCKVNPYAN